MRASLCRFRWPTSFTLLARALEQLAHSAAASCSNRGFPLTQPFRAPASFSTRPLGSATLQAATMSGKDAKAKGGKMEKNFMVDFLMGGVS